MDGNGSEKVVGEEQVSTRRGKRDSLWNCWQAWEAQGRMVLREIAKAIIEKCGIMIPGGENPVKTLNQMEEVLLREVKNCTPPDLGFICFVNQSTNLYADDNSGRSIMWHIVLQEVKREILRQLERR